LNHGYRLCRTATSDSAFDLGRTPGTMGATFAYIPNGEVTEPNLVAAFKNRQTAIGWNESLAVLRVNDKYCGEILPCDGKSQNAVLTIYCLPDQKVAARIIRNGEIYKEFSGVMPESGKLEFKLNIAESAKAWYTALVSPAEKPQQVLAAASPIYFGDWSTPAATTAIVKGTVYDRQTKTPLKAKVEILSDSAQPCAVQTDSGKFVIGGKIYSRLRVSAPGYVAENKSITEALPLSEYIKSISQKELCDWSTYEKLRETLQNLQLDFALKKAPAKKRAAK